MRRPVAPAAAASAAARSACLFQRAAALGLCFSLAAAAASYGGDILRGGTGTGAAPRGGSGSGRAPGVNPAADLARVNARDALVRSTRAVQSVKALQARAREIAIKGPPNLGPNPANPAIRLPDVTDGLRPGGLQVARGVPVNLAAPTAGEDASLWRGANLPTQTTAGDRTVVTVKQTQQQAVLNWQTFNVGRKTTLRFDQSAGKADQGKWTAFNKVNDPSGVPSQILGSIEAPGHVYVVNRNGIIFGGSSQVNARAFVASTLPINDNLIRQGLLNNPDSQFLFSALPVPGGADGTPAFNPTINDPEFRLTAGAPTYTLAETVALTPSNALVRAPEFTFTAADGSRARLAAGTDYTLATDTATGRATATFTAAGLAKVGAAAVTASYTPKVVKTGDVVVQAGAQLRTPPSRSGNGGRVMLVGTNVRNEGSIATPSGQTILAAGQQVGVTPHASNDPSLRGLDVWIGAAADGTGTATNTGLIETFTGSTFMGGRAVNQLGVIRSTTSVTLNGRIDLVASFGAVSNPNWERSSLPQFLNQQTGTVRLGLDSITDVLPDYASGETVPGTALPERSQVNVEGRAIHLEERASILAPNADVHMRAGTWPYRDANGDGTTLGADGLNEVGLESHFEAGRQRFLLNAGQIYVDKAASINVAGTPDVFVPLSHSILPVEFRGFQLADSPVQRTGPLRAVPLTIDLRITGENNGIYWMGTPLGDAVGLAGLIQRNVAQLTARGGHVTMNAGTAIVVQKGAAIDVSGGFFRHEAGMVETSRLLQAGNIVPIEQALPGFRYSGVYTGEFVRDSGKWGVTERFIAPFSSGRRFDPGYIEGAAGGTLSLSAPAMAIDGTLRGITISGPRQREARPALSQLSISFEAQRRYEGSGSLLQILQVSPTPPSVVAGAASSGPAPGKFTLAGDGAAALPAERLSRFVLPSQWLDEEGFGQISVKNPDGTIDVPADVQLQTTPGGSIALSGSNVTVSGRIAAPGGTVSLRAYNLSPTQVQTYLLDNAQTPQAQPAASAQRGRLTVNPGAAVTVAGLLVDDRLGARDALSQPLVLDGGKISIEAFSAQIAEGSTLDVSGGASVTGPRLPSFVAGGAGVARGMREHYGAGGTLTVYSGRDLSLPSVTGGTLTLDGTLQGYGGQTGGTLNLRAQVVQIGGTPEFPRALVIAPEFFQQGGFKNFQINGIGALSGPATLTQPAKYFPAVSVAPGVTVEPRAQNWLLQSSADGDTLSLAPILKPIGVRPAASLSLLGAGADDSFTTDRIEARADIVIGAGSSIRVEPGAGITISGDTATILGSLTAPGGSIALRGASRFPLPSDATVPGTPQVTVHIGATARISAAGASLVVPDGYGQQRGLLLNGGTITTYGDIVAEKGAVLDVSGIAGTLDLQAAQLRAFTGPSVAAASGLTEPLWRAAAETVRRESDGGLIELEGSHLLLTDATLLGRAGGDTARGGTLSIHSGRFYTGQEVQRSSDINLVVKNSGDFLTGAATIGVGKVVTGAGGAPIAGLGYFAADRFAQGGFSTLELGAKAFPSAGSPLNVGGGNVRFDGAVSIRAAGAVRIAGGGVVEANAGVTIDARYVSVGQPFRPPLNPADRLTIFQHNPNNQVLDFALAPTTGPGKLAVRADLIDLGNLSLQNVGQALFDSAGDIRGNGVVSMRGDLTLRAAQVYPTSLSTLKLFAYDPAGGRGSIRIIGNGRASATPLSAGGDLQLFARQITQDGTLRAPLGTITVGWDGLTDFDPTDADIDPPFDPLSRGTLGTPIAADVSLTGRSITSVGFDASGAFAQVPFGVSPDGFSWIDPRGINVTATGLPQKRITIAGQAVRTAARSQIDIRGGGDLSAFRWIPGVGGSIDRLGTATKSWTRDATYQAGDLVLHNGQTWSARARSAGETPGPGLFWSRVAESFAIVPGYRADFAPENAFAVGNNAGLLQGNPGFVFTPDHGADRVLSSLANVRRTDGGFQVGQQIYLDQTPSLRAGLYTLLPRRYALLPGALLVTPLAGDPAANFTNPEGATFTSGYVANRFERPAELDPLRTRFEVAPGAVVRGRAAYDQYSGNTFFAEASRRLEIERPQRLPQDGGALAFSGNTALRLEGTVLAGRMGRGLGSTVDISSSSDIYLIGGRGAAPANAQVALRTTVLESWGAGSLLIGGLRRELPTGTEIATRTDRVVLDNRGTTFSGAEITLASRAEVSVAQGSAITARASDALRGDTFRVTGAGSFLQVSGAQSTLERSSVPLTNNTPRLTIGAGVQIGGRSVTLDSTAGTKIDALTSIDAGALALGSRQISILLEPVTGALPGQSIDPQLQIAGEFLQTVQSVGAVTLRSYSTIDVHGAGAFGGDKLQRLSLQAGGLRGFGRAGQDAIFSASEVLFGNTAGVPTPAAPGAAGGGLRVNAGTLRLGSGAFSASGFSSVALNATGGVLGEGTGSFATPSALTISAPLVTGARGASHSITAGGDLVLARSTGEVKITGELGARFAFQGASVQAATDFRLQSGELSLRATTGDVVVGGTIDVSGASRTFYDITRYSNAGRVLLNATQGSVQLNAGSRISVAAAGSGEAGTLSISAIQGTLRNLGSTLLGQASADARSGSFLMDVARIDTYAGVNNALQSGGFFNERNVRLRTGSVVIDGASRARQFTLSADAGSITVAGSIDASGLSDVAGRTGGKITLSAGESLTIENGARLTTRASQFDAAGKGGAIRLEAGAAIDGIANESARLDVQTGATIDLGVDALVAGGITDPLSSAFRGRFTGTLHLRAPRIGNDVAVAALGGEIRGASSILVEGFRAYDQSATGALDTALLQQVHGDATAFMDAGYAAMETRLLGLNAGLRDALVIAPGIEIVSRSGSLVLGTDVEDYRNDWDLSGMRYGPREAAGVLTLRAAGNLEFKNALSDGFAGEFSPNDFGEEPPDGQKLWLRPLMDVKASLPVNTQSWTYRLTAGADLSAADFQRVRPLDTLASGEGSILIGKLLPKPINGGPDATTGAAIENRLSFVRTGAGEITLGAGRDVQLRNSFASVYTAGVRLPYSNTISAENDVRLMSIFGPNDFAAPVVELNATTSHPSQGGLGIAQQPYAAQYSMAGGNVSIAAQGDVARYALNDFGQPVIDSSRQLPTNWLYRRGYIDPLTGRFGESGPGFTSDLSASTTWWVDFSNFFQGFGALGGGNVALSAQNVVNADAVAPTNARMAGRDAAAGINFTPDASRMLELGGGDVTIRATGDIDGGIYYAERGRGVLRAGGEIKTNAARAPITLDQPTADSRTWLPTTVFVGKSSFDVSAGGNVLLGPVTNPFLLPQGVNNKYWYKSYFSTFSSDAAVNVASFGGNVTHRLAVNLPNSLTVVPTLQRWMDTQNRLVASNSSNSEPWLRLAETTIDAFSTVVTIGAPTLRSTAFAGDVNLVGNMNLFPSATGTLELAASQGIIGLQPTGIGAALLGGVARPVTVWASSKINVSDVDPAGLPGITSPLGLQAFVSREQLDRSSALPFATLDLAFAETGSTRVTIEKQRALHSSTVLHAGDRDPVRLFALSGDVTAVQLFSPKATRIVADNDISDVSLYLQNVAPSDISVVSAGRDITLFNENSRLRSAASDLLRGNSLSVSETQQTVLGTAIGALPGDLQIGGPGVLEVFAGRTLDLGSGANLPDGTGLGITSVGNLRNPFLSATGADLLLFAGVKGRGGEGAAFSLLESELDFAAFGDGGVKSLTGFESEYRRKLGLGSSAPLTDEQKAIVAMEVFYARLRQTGRDFPTTGSYADGELAIATLFGDAGDGAVFTRARDVRTAADGAISISVPGGGVTMASDIFGNPLTPPGIVTEAGGGVSVFTEKDVDIGQARIFTLRGGDMILWSSEGNIAAGNAPKTVVTAPPTRVLIDVTTADVQTDLGGLATGGGIGVLASVEGVAPGDVDLIAPKGVVDAGDAGIRSTGNLTIAATAVLNASNIQVGGTAAGVPSAPTVAAPNLGGLSAASNAAGASSNTAQQMAQQQQRPEEKKEEVPSVISVEVLGFGDGSAPPAAAPAPAAPPPPAPSPSEEEEKKKKAAESAPRAA